MIDDLTELRRVIGIELSDVHTCIPGQIVAWDGTHAMVKPALAKSLASGETLAAPNVVRVPVCFPRGAGGKAIISVPLTAGDPVLLHFAERALENWLSGKDDAEPGDPRQFDLSDAFATPVCRPGVGEAVDTQNLVIQLDRATIVITKDGSITVTAAAGATINAPDGLTVNADITVNGKIDATGDITGAGISLKSHKHGGVQSGGSTTGGPQ